MMEWRVAKSLNVLLAQINALSPNRDKSSDGSIGDVSHSARTSDHNPDTDGVVKARDFTNDPVHGINSEGLAEALRSARDPRIKYIISNRKIAASYPVDGHPAWSWRPYTGINPHNHHVHVSVLRDALHYDSTEPWVLNFSPVAEQVSSPAVLIHPVLRMGNKGPDVAIFQHLLNAKGSVLKEDGDFGPSTKSAVEIFQLKNDLIVDGVVGGYTWKLLKQEKL